ncbi:hypothetical protein H5U35_02090, partial [Candidatus Aerophobetes bacterium]|nr:hypothetical protein [Candidatus Aerophobetes bacterium]
LLNELRKKGIEERKIRLVSSSSQNSTDSSFFESDMVERFYQIYRELAL